MLGAGALLAVAGVVVEQALPELYGQTLTSVHPETRIFVQVQGM